jgi:hypothetical protein
MKVEESERKWEVQTFIFASKVDGWSDLGSLVPNLG